MKTDFFQSCGHCWAFQICWHIECSTFTASSFRILSSSAGITSPPLAMFVEMFPKAHLTSYSRMSGSRWVTKPSWLSGSLIPFLYSSSVYSCLVFLISSASVRSLKFVFYCAHPCMKCFLDISNVPEEISIDFPILLLSSISLHCSLKKAFLFLLAILWNSAFSCIHHSLSSLLCTSLLSSSICKTSSDNHFGFLQFFFFGMVLVTVSCTMLQTFVHSSSGTLSPRSNPLILFFISTIKS